MIDQGNERRIERLLQECLNPHAPPSIPAIMALFLETRRNPDLLLNITPADAEYLRCAAWSVADLSQKCAWAAGDFGRNKGLLDETLKPFAPWLPGQWANFAGAGVAEGSRLMLESPSKLMDAGGDLHPEWDAATREYSTHRARMFAAGTMAIRGVIPKAESGPEAPPLYQTLDVPWSALALTSPLYWRAELSGLRLLQPPYDGEDSVDAGWRRRNAAVLLMANHLANHLPPHLAERFALVVLRADVPVFQLSLWLDRSPPSITYAIDRDPHARFEEHTMGFRLGLVEHVEKITGRTDYVWAADNRGDCAHDLAARIQSGVLDWLGIGVALLDRRTGLSASGDRGAALHRMALQGLQAAFVAPSTTSPGGSPILSRALGGKLGGPRPDLRNLRAGTERG